MPSKIGQAELPRFQSLVGRLETRATPIPACRYYHGKVTAIDVDVLNRLCKALNCQPGDLLVYVPDEESEKLIDDRSIAKPPYECTCRMKRVKSPESEGRD